MSAGIRQAARPAIAATGALAFAVAVPLAAFALSGTVSTAKADVIETEAEEVSTGTYEVELIAHDHGTDAEYDAEGVTYEVDYADGTGYVSGTEDETDLWLGFGVGENDDFLDDIVGGDITYTVSSITGPSGSDIYIDGPGSNDVYAAVGSYTAGSESLTIDEHMHPDWYFSDTGTYTITFEASVTPKGGVSVSYPEGDEVTITFSVVS